MTQAIQQVCKNYFFDLCGIREIAVEAQLLPVELCPTDADQLNIRFLYPDNRDRVFTLAQDNRILFHHEKIGTWFPKRFPFLGKLVIEIPGSYCGNLKICTSNAEIMGKPLFLGQMKAVTSNAAVRFEGLRCDLVEIHSSNGTISIERLQSGDISLQTSNAPITGTILGDIEEYAITSRTSNAINNLPGSFGMGKRCRLSAHTSNGCIGLEFIR